MEALCKCPHCGVPSENLKLILPSCEHAVTLEQVTKWKENQVKLEEEIIVLRKQIERFQAQYGTDSLNGNSSFLFYFVAIQYFIYSYCILLIFYAKETVIPSAQPISQNDDSRSGKERTQEVEEPIKSVEVPSSSPPKEEVTMSPAENAIPTQQQRQRFPFTDVRVDVITKEERERFLYEFTMADLNRDRYLDCTLIA